MRSGNWFLTYSGKKFYVTDPHPDDVCIEDIAHALSLTCRFNGHVREFYSVGQHSVLVKRFVERRHAGLIGLYMHALIHDATEAYLGDIIRPLKVTMPEYKALEEKTEAIIYQALGLGEPPQGTSKARVKYADDTILMTERRDLLNASGHKWDMVAGEPDPEKIEGWSPRVAEDVFLVEYYRLRRLLDLPAHSYEEAA